MLSIAFLVKLFVFNEIAYQNGNHMRKFTFSLLLLASTLAVAQAPQGFNYQTVVRNATGEVIANQNVKFMVRITDITGGTIFYSEPHVLTTNSVGLINFIVGDGTTLVGEFEQIPWSEGNLYLDIFLDPTGGNEFVFMGSSPLQSVPYALFAASGNEGPQGEVGPQGPPGPLVPGTNGQTLRHNGTDWVSNSILFNSGTNVGVGTTTPPARFTVSGNLANPTIPSATSSAILRIGNVSYPQEGIDIGHMSGSPYSGWIQVGYNGVAEPLSLQPLGGSLGIGTIAPTQTLDVNGLVRIRGGSPGTGKILTSAADGTASWQTPPQGSNWTVSGQDIYRLTGNVGVGTVSPTAKFDVAGGDPTEEQPIFAVRNNDGQIVFAVYQSGVRVYVDDAVGKSSRGGFAVGGLVDQTKASQEYFRLTPDSVRIFIREGANKSSRGGFAVGTLVDQTKTGATDLFYVSRDSARIYFDDSPAKSSRGGFAVGGLVDQTKSSSSFMFITPENYLIGQQAGANLTTGGVYNSFLGYQAGLSTTIGKSNIFVGFKSGYSNLGGTGNLGSYNFFAGNESGYANTTWMG